MCNLTASKIIYMNTQPHEKIRRAWNPVPKINLAGTGKFFSYRKMKYKMDQLLIKIFLNRFNFYSFCHLQAMKCLPQTSLSKLPSSPQRIPNAQRTSEKRMICQELNWVFQLLQVCMHYVVKHEGEGHSQGAWIGIHMGRAKINRFLVTLWDKEEQMWNNLHRHKTDFLAFTVGPLGCGWTDGQIHMQRHPQS